MKIIEKKKRTKTKKIADFYFSHLLHVSGWVDWGVFLEES